MQPSPILPSPPPSAAESPAEPPLASSGAWVVLAAYFVAFALAVFVTVGLVVAVAAVRASGNIDGMASQALAFAGSSTGLMASAAVDAAVLVCVALGAARLIGRDVPAVLRLRKSRASAAGFCAAVTGILGLTVACGAASELLPIRGGSVLDTLAQALHGLGPARFVVALLAIGAAPGLAEETFFRGLMQARLAARWGRWPAIVTTSFAFGLIHLDWLQSTLAFVAGLFLGWVAEQLGGIRPTILAHALNNATFVALTSLGSSKSDDSKSSQVVLLAAGAAVCVASILVLRGRAAVRA